MNNTDLPRLVLVKLNKNIIPRYEIKFVAFYKNIKNMFFLFN